MGIPLKTLVLKEEKIYFPLSINKQSSVCFSVCLQNLKAEIST